MLAEAEEIILNGNRISIGIAIGRPFFLNRDDYPVFEQELLESDVEREINRYRMTLSRCRKDIKRLQKQLEAETAYAGISILDAQLEMLHDPLLTLNIEKEIRGTRRNAEFILQKTLEQFRKKFESSDDIFFHERFKDLKDLSGRIFSYLHESGNFSLNHVPPNSIVCTEELTASDAAEATAANINAFITEKGGATSHAAIVAKAKGIPYVTGIDLQKLKDHAAQHLIVDGRTGDIIVNPSEATLEKYEKIRQSIQHQYQKLEKMSDRPAETYDGHTVRLFANLETANEIDMIHHLGGRGVGLFRSEYIFLPKNEIPNENDQYAIYSNIMNRIKGLPVVFRTFDLGGDKTSSRFSFPEEHHSFLGCRSTKFLLREKTVFKTQLRAIVRASLLGDISLLFPMITTLSELREAKKVVTEVQDELQIDKKIRIGCMIEIPSAALIAEHFAEECDFLSIGTNDLVQYTLAVHRGDHALSEFYEPTDPSIIRLIKLITDEANKKNIPVAVCGEIASDPRFTSLLLGLGVQELSVIPRCLPFIKNAIRNTSIIDAVFLADTALTLTTAQEVLQLISEDYQKNVPHDLFYNI